MAAGSAGSAATLGSRAFQAPPPAITRSGPGQAVAAPVAKPAATVYSIGSPTDEEQLWLELVNYERANPQAEAQILESTTNADVLSAYSYFGVELNVLASAFAAISPAPPLSMNAELLAAARGHSQDMLAHTYQGHVGSDGSTFEQRIAAQGYTGSTEGENVFAFATSIFYGNAGFEVDWGANPPTGMQDPPGHRTNDHDGAYAEVGIGITDGTANDAGTEYGPIVCTMDFGTQTSYTPFVTGVAYYDLNGNGSYDMGEGLGGVTVKVSGASDSAITANSGGYSVPVSGAGNRMVTFSASGMTDQQVTVTLTGTSNVKVDLKLAYPPPVVSGPANPPVNQQSNYQFTAVPGATSYQFKESQLAPFTTVETGASGTAEFTVTSTGSYSVIASDEEYDGVPSFHLAHLTPDEQALKLNFTLFPGAASALQFETLLGYATNTEVASAQVSADGGTTWQTVWSQAGTNGSGDSAFNAQSASLSQFAGEEILVRFVYDANGTSFYNTADTGVGFYVDNIQVTNCEMLTATSVTAVTSGTTFAFEPMVTGSFALAVRPEVGTRFFPYGPDDVVTAAGGGGGGSAPSATTNPATEVSATSATLNGSVNPNGTATSAYFQWGLNTSYGSSTPPVSIGSGTSAIATDAALGPLAPGQTYHYRLTGSNANGTANGGDEMFTTGSGISFSGFKARYIGVIVSSPPANAVSGIITLTVSANGSFTASGKLGGKSFSFTGRFNAVGAYSATLKNGVEVQLQLVSLQAPVVSGTFTAGGVAGAITLDPVAVSGSAAAFTFRLPHPAGAGLPQGDGYGTLKLPAKSATATFSGKLGDGTAISYGGSVVLDASDAAVTQVPVYIPLYGGKGSISGILTREANANGDLDGVLTWIKPATTGAYLPSPFTTQVSLYGSLYTRPQPGQPIIALTSGTVTLDGGDLTNPLQKAVTLGTNNKITVTSPAADRLKMSINTANGLFSGSFVDPDKGKTVSFNGAVFQGGLNIGTGVFKGPEDPGEVELK